MKKRSIIAFDFGSKNIGTAIGQELTGIVQALQPLKVRSGALDWNKIITLLTEWQPHLLVVGLPLNMDGSEQLITRQARKFANQLHGRFGVQIALQDERLSTVEARAKLFDYGGFRALNKSSIDSISATIILESWFECQKK